MRYIYTYSMLRYTYYALNLFLYITFIFTVLYVTLLHYSYYALNLL